MGRLAYLLWGIFLSSLAFALFCYYQIGSAEYSLQKAVETWEQATVAPTYTLETKPEFPSDLLGIVVFPEIQLKLPLVKGISEEDLRKGVGHDPKTPLPGEIGNTVLAGHRDGVFRRLGELQNGDDMVIETSKGSFYYQMVDHKIVDKNNIHAVQPSESPRLTLITCYPFSFIGDAPQRYIIEATLKEQNNPR